MSLCGNSLVSVQTQCGHFFTCAEKSTLLSLSPELCLLRCFSFSASRHRRSLPW